MHSDLHLTILVIGIAIRIAVFALIFVGVHNFFESAREKAPETTEFSFSRDLPCELREACSSSTADIQRAPETRVTSASSNAFQFIGSGRSVASQY